MVTPVFEEALRYLDGGGERIGVTGLWGSSKALFLFGLAVSAGRPVVAVSPTPKEAQALYADLSFFAAQLTPDAPRRHALFPPWDVLPYDVMGPDPAVVSERLGVLKAVASGEAGVVVTSVKAFAQRLPAPGSLVGPEAAIYLLRGFEFGREALLSRLGELGYSRASAVYEPGEFAVRGGILDVFPAGAGSPVRVEFAGDTIESMRIFDPDTQRSVSEVEELSVNPAKEAARGGAASGLESDLTGYFRERPLILLDEPERVEAQFGELMEKAFRAYEESGGPGGPAGLRPERFYLTAGETDALLKGGPVVELSSLAVASGREGYRTFHYRTRSVEGMRLREVVPEPWPEEIPKTPVAIFCRNLRALMGGRSVNVVSPTRGQAERLGEIFAEHGVPAEYGPPSLGRPAVPVPVRLLVGELSAGFLMEPAGLMFVASTEVFGERPKRAPAPRAKVERFLTSLSELAAGDYVVHVDHGIGRYQGLKRLTLLGVEGDFLDVVYAGSDRLYVPVDELGKVQKYIGAEAAAPAPDKLGGAAWERAKARAKKAVREMAGELLKLYAQRAVAEGFAYSPDDHLYREMEASFEYEETPDQARAIAEVKADLESPHPMDRLVCGDVGYGKTEVAIRAAFKAALDGKQAAVLVPTTLLADQHYKTFSARLAPFPVRVEMLSRFTPKPRVKEVKEGLAAGTVDIVIGTHRLLQRDVAFHDLGLLVIDEEHRFGVAHKEKLKQLRRQVDVLTLSATPIPRTLNLSLSGIRDLSIIETPPPDRLPIKTVVARFDRAAIREAVLREIMRGGQVFFVHNRIEGIYAIGDMLRATVPEAKVGVAHGRMREDALDEVMGRFIAGEYDILLTTSIIESGLDIPSANTIVIDRADRFGLADLYQLRGRVGRSRVRAYAYLLVPGGDALTEAAGKRLRVLGELAELGAGFRLALHDLEIRGAGNVLGAEQSGHISAVGFELYTSLLEEAVKELRGEEAELAVEPALDLKVSAFIPDAYVPETRERLGIYKRLAGAKDVRELGETANELADRYGPMPPEAVRLVEVMELKVLARELKVAGLQLLSSEVKITFTDKVEISPDKLTGYLSKNRGLARYVPQYSLFIKRPSGGWERLFGEIKNCLKELA